MSESVMIARACALVSSVITILLSAVVLGLAADQHPPSPAEYGMRMEEAWIPMKDGVRLAANLYLPDGGKRGEKFPALLEYLPYRKDDGTLERDYPLYSYFARRGYVGARVDIRGTGRSEGNPPDREYSEQEQLDALEVIDWLSRQSWSNGNVGMWGISWGAFNSIQVAARRPAALKAIIAIEGTEDLYQDDVHFIDGMWHTDSYEVGMDIGPTITPSPDFSLDEAILGPRFENPPWSLLYLSQQRDGPFWRRASLLERYEAIQVPTFLIAGWFDGYRDSVPRMLERMNVPMKAIIGPWGHYLPHKSVPGPQIEWRREAVRWWDRWLKGRETGIMEEPPIAIYVRHWYPPDVDTDYLFAKELPGEWRTEQKWPPARLRTETVYLRSDHTLGPAVPAHERHNLKYVPSAHPAAGFWWGDLTPDQRPADAYSLVYDSEPLTKETEILGLPRAILHVSATAPLAHWFVRLSDVAPDGSVTLVTGAGFNGAHHDSSMAPKPLEPGKIYRLDVEMHFTSWVFPPGHRIRLAVSNSQWPMIWPTPHPMTTSLHLGGEHASHLTLPVIPPADRPRPNFLAPDSSEPAPGVRSIASPPSWTIHRDVFSRRSTVEWKDSGTTEFPWGRSEFSLHMIYQIQDTHPEAPSFYGEVRITQHLEDRVVTWRGQLDLSSDVNNFLYRHRREIYQDGLLVRDKTWDRRIPRDYQ